MQSKKLLNLSCLTILALFLISCSLSTAPAPPKSAEPPPQVVSTSKPAVPASAPSATPKPDGDQPKSGGILTTTSRHLIPHFDMHQDVSIALQFPLAPAYSLLIQTDPQNEDKVVGDLAKNWDVSPDGLTYTFHLNQGVKFHNGKPLTAEDVKFNLDRIVFPPKGVIGARKDLYGAVDKIEAPDPATLRITLKNAQASFLQLLASPFNFVFAPEVIRDKGDMKRDIVGAGAFKLQSYTDGVSLKLQKNPDYFVKGRPYLDGITTYIIVDEMSRIAAMRTKQVLMLPFVAEVTSVQAEQLKKSEPRLVVVQRPQTGLYGIIFNTKAKPWDDVRVRQAVNIAMDREAAAKVIRAGGYLPAYGYYIAGSEWNLPEQELMAMPGFRKPKDQDIAEAKRLLAEAGYPQGFKIAPMAATSIVVQETAEFSMDQMAKIGLTGEMKLLEKATASANLYKSAFDVAVYGDASATLDPDAVLGEIYLSTSAKNYGKWSSQEYDRLYKTQSVTLDVAKRKEIVWEMQRLIHREAPRANAVWAARQAIWWDEVKGPNPGKTQYSNNKFEDVWLAR